MIEEIARYVVLLPRKTVSVPGDRQHFGACQCAPLRLIIYLLGMKLRISTNV